MTPDLLSPDQSALDTALLAAHDANDRAALIRLYTEAADLSRDKTARTFYLTHAYVFALEAGHEDAPHLKSCLVAEGADLPDPP